MASSSGFPFLRRSFLLAATLWLVAAMPAARLAASAPQQPKKASPQAADRADSTVTPGVTPQRPSDERALFAMFAKIQQLRAEYREEKHLSLLAVPLKSRGRLCYLGGADRSKPSGFLTRIVDAPEKAKLTITPTELRMQDKDGSEVIDLRQSDRMRLFVTSLLQVFGGNREALRKLYRVRYSLHAQDPRDWQLELVPIKESLRPVLKRLLLHGRNQAVTRIELEENNGDRTVTNIVKAAVDSPFTAAEKLELFGVQAAAEKQR